jgi:predicted amidohydrolase YtcJ
VTVFSSVLLLAACKHTEPADVLFTNGVVHLRITDAEVADLPVVTTALAVRGGVVAAIEDEALALEGPDTVKVDLGGGHVYPGFHDAHVHMLAGNFALNRLLLLGTPSMQSMANQVEDYAAGAPDEPWIVGYGWLSDTIDDPSGVPITAVLPDRPALLMNQSGHEAIINQAAMDAAGIDRNTPDPPGGTIARDENGDPTGFLVEAAVSLVSDLVLAAYDDATLSQGLVDRLRVFSSSGLTGMSEILAVPGFDIGRPWIYSDLEASGELPMRVTFYMPIFAMSDFDDIDEVRTQYDGDLVRFGGAKVWVDGSMGSGQAWVKEPYEGSTDDYGSHYWDTAGLTQVIAEAEARQVPLKMHVNGDAAIDTALDAMEAVATQNGGLEQRYAFEHVVLPSDSDFARMQALGVVASIQPTHYVAARLGDTAQALGERFDSAYDFRGLVDAGIPVALGTDWPVWPAQQPLLVAWNGVTSRDEGQSLSLAEALVGYAEGGARAINREDELGRLEPGYVADLVVFAADPLAVPIDDVPDVAIQQVWVGGRKVYGGP